MKPALVVVIRNLRTAATKKRSLQLLISYQYFQELIATGRYQSISDEMKNYVGKILKKWGDDFNSEIFIWLKNNLPKDRYMVFKGVKLNRISNVKLQENLGDVDIFIIDKHRKIFISTECKNVNAARTSSEIVSELNRFEGNWINKHLKRHKWSAKI